MCSRDVIVLSQITLLKYGRNARIIGVGVTPQVGESLQDIVTDAETDYFEVDDFFGLQGRVQQIIDEVRLASARYQVIFSHIIGPHEHTCVHITFKCM